jgi:MFS transporter, Spinster family, sphingosine-1-phosphate transporter
MLFGLGFGFVDANNMPILCQLARPQYRATGYGLMNLASIGTGAGVTLAMGAMRDRQIPLSLAFLVSAGLAAFALVLILFIRPANPKP